MVSDGYRFGEGLERRKKAALAISDDYLKLIGDDGDNVHVKSIVDLMERIRSGNYTIVVAGEVSAGKSTFINALLGEDILPSSVLQSTSAVVELVKSPERILSVEYGDGTVQEYRDDPTTPDRDESVEKLKELGALRHEYRKIPTGAINEFLLMGRTNFDNLQEVFEQAGAPYDEERDKKAREYIAKFQDLKEIPRRIQFKYPLRFKVDEIRLVDTPGVNARGGLESLTMKYLPEANAIIFVKNIEPIESESFKNFVNSYVPNISKDSVFLVLTHAGNKTEEQVTNLLSEARRLFGKIEPRRITAVDGFMRLVEVTSDFRSKSMPQIQSEVLSDPKKNRVIGPLLWEFPNDRDSFMRELKRRHNFETFLSVMEPFADSGPNNQIVELLERVQSKCGERKAQIEKDLNKLSRFTHPAELNAQISKETDDLSRFEETMKKFSMDLARRYKGQEGLLKQEANRLKDAFVARVAPAVDKGEVMKVTADFDDELSAAVDRVSAQMAGEYSAKLDETSTQFERDGELLVPRVDIRAIETAASENAFVAYQEKVTRGAKHSFFKGLRRVINFVGADADALLKGKGIDQFETRKRWDVFKFLEDFKGGIVKSIQENAAAVAEVGSALIDKFDATFRTEVARTVAQRKVHLRELAAKRDEAEDQQHKVLSLQRRKTQYEAVLDRLTRVLEECRGD